MIERFISTVLFLVYSGSLITGSVDSTIRVWHQSITASANSNGSNNALNLLDDSLNNSLENGADGNHTSSSIHHSQHSHHGLGNIGLTRSHSHTNLLSSTAGITASNGNDRDRAGSNLSEDGVFDGEGGDGELPCVFVLFVFTYYCHLLALIVVNCVIRVCFLCGRIYILSSCTYLHCLIFTTCS